MVRQSKREIRGLIGWSLVCFLVAALGAMASLQAKSFYAELVQPSWAPPASVFGPVWSILYIMMAFSVWLVWCQRKTLAVRLFVIQLILNGLWSWLFFAWHLGGYAFLDILCLWGCLVATIFTFWRAKKIAALLLLPYFCWVSFAAFLNYSIWQLNPVLLG